MPENKHSIVLWVCMSTFVYTCMRLVNVFVCASVFCMYMWKYLRFMQRNLKMEGKTLECLSNFHSTSHRLYLENKRKFMFVSKNPNISSYFFKYLFLSISKCPWNYKICMHNIITVLVIPSAILTRDSHLLCSSSLQQCTICSPPIQLYLIHTTCSMFDISFYVCIHFISICILCASILFPMYC